MKKLKNSISALVLGATLGAAALPALSVTPSFAQNAADAQFDVRPKVAQILNAIKKQLAAATPDRPLVVVVGGNHALPADAMTMKFLLEDFAKLPEAKGKKFAVGLDRPHNYLQKTLDIATRGEVPAGLSSWLEFLDINGQNALRVTTGISRQETSPMAHNALYAYLIEQNISTGFNDAARDGEFIDANVPGTARLLPPGWRGTPVSAKSGAGQNQRSMIMAYNGKYHMSIKKPDVYFHFGGFGHVFGDASMGTDYPHSLTAQFTAFGYKVLPVILSADSRSLNIPPMAEDAVKSGLFLKGTTTQNIEPRGPNDVPVMQTELSIMHKICTNSGRPAECFNMSVMNYPYREEVKANYSVWIELARSAQRTAPNDLRVRGR